MLVTACFIQASIDILFHIDINICLKTRFLFHEIHISYRMLILRIIDKRNQEFSNAKSIKFYCLSEDRHMILKWL